jgi:hypothetical protein
MIEELDTVPLARHLPELGLASGDPLRGREIARARQVA